MERYELENGRRDVHVPNESDGFVFASAALRGRGLMPGDPPWQAATGACEILPLVLEREDPVNVRVVVGGALEAAEKAEWVGRVQGGLRVPDGRLALCGGAAYLIDAGDWTEEYARVVSIPAGDYRATVYCYASAPNGRLCLEQAGGDEPFGAWFRRTRSGEGWPAWLHNWCVNDPEQDPGHEKEWKRAREKRRAHVIDVLLHLEPASDVAPAPVGDHGFAEATDCRKPEKFPLGLAPRDLAGLEDDEDGEEEDAPAPPPQPSAAAGARTGRFTLEPIAGGPVDVPVAKLTRVFRLAWFCQPYTQPEIRVTLPEGAKRPKAAEIENVRVAGKDREIQLSIDNNGQPTGALEALTPLGKELASLPDGSVIELDTARKDTSGTRPLALHRYRGTVAAGSWRVAEAFPPVDATRFAEALALAEAAEGGKTLRARDEAEAEAIAARVAKHAPYFFHSNPLLRNGVELGVKRRDPQAVTQLAMRAFWLRYADTWTLRDFDMEPE